MIYVTSDTHFSHKAIMTYENRPFKNIDEMNNTIINNWNSIVKAEDTVYHLGDVAFTNKTFSKHIVQSLIGHKILIMGNHDCCRTRKWWLDCGFDEVHREPILITVNGEQVLLTHDPIAGMYVPEDILVVHGHIHSKQIAGYVKPRFNCVCVELTNYTPVELEKVIQ